MIMGVMNVPSWLIWLHSNRKARRSQENVSGQFLSMKTQKLARKCYAQRGERLIKRPRVSRTYTRPEDLVDEEGAAAASACTPSRKANSASAFLRLGFMIHRI